MFAKATLRINFTFDGLPHFFFLRRKFNWKTAKTLAPSTLEVL